MNFDLNDEERALQQGIRDLCRGRFPLDQTRTAGLTKDGWRALTEAGVFSLCLPEHTGGVGLGVTQAVIVFEELGRALVPGPVVGSHLAAGLIGEGRIAGGIDRGDDIVEHLDALDDLIVLDDEGIWRVDPRALDATPVERPLDLLTPLHRITSLPQGEQLAGPSVAAAWRLEGAALTGALAVGIASAGTDVAVAYAKERHQFGRPIGSFQAIKHICADMLVRAEVARAAVYAAGVTIDDPTVGDAARAVAGAKLLACDAALANGKACVQVHGGMGFTWEVDAHLYLKRAALLATHFGGADEHAERVASYL